MMPTTKFRIEFKGVPPYRAQAITVPAENEEIARQWADKQLEAWGIKPNKITIKIMQVLPVPEVVQETEQKPAIRRRKRSKKENKDPK